MRFIPPFVKLVSRSSGLALCASLWLGACALTPPKVDSSEPVSVESNLQTPWWQDFNDILLNDLIAQALRANTSIQTAQSALQQARALRDVALAATRFNLTLSGTAQRSQSEFSNAVSTFKSGLDARWELDVFGANASQLNASEADAKAVQFSLADVQLSVTCEVALAYIQLRSQQTQLSIAQQNLSIQQKTQDMTNWRTQAGMSSELDLAQSRAATAQTAAQIPALQSALAKTRHSLAILTAQQPKAMDQVLSDTKAIPQTSHVTDFDIPADTLRQRPDVRAAQQRVEAALQRSHVAEAATKPGFNLGGTLSWTAMTLSGVGSAPLASSLLGSVSFPLFDGGATKSQVLAQNAALQQTRLAYENAVLVALKDVEDALTALHHDHLRLAQWVQSASASTQAATLAQHRYTSGLTDFQTVLQTQRTLQDAQNSVASVQADLSADHVGLIKALGGGWQELPITINR